MFYDDSEETNEPARLSGAPGMGGRRRTVTAKEAKERRTAMADLMSNGLTTDEIVEAMGAKYGMTEDEVLRLREKVRASMATEYDENAPLHKQMASRRIHRHIVSAAKARQWGAVAQLESQLSKIQGTESPTEQHITVDARLQQATLHVLGNMSPSQIQELVAEELRRLPSTATPPSQHAEEDFEPEHTSHRSPLGPAGECPPP